jgi:hypothetical protein
LQEEVTFDIQKIGSLELLSMARFKVPVSFEYSVLFVS